MPMLLLTLVGSMACSLLCTGLPAKQYISLRNEARQQGMDIAGRAVVSASSAILLVACGKQRCISQQPWMANGNNSGCREPSESTSALLTANR